MRQIAPLIVLLSAVALVGQSRDLCGNRGATRAPAPIYKWWLEQDVRWIITDEERTAFKRLQNDVERDQFIDMFWLRRDPTPDTVENEFKDEHYRRLMYANQHFGTSIPGWRTDRGRIYIMEGPPDEISNDTAKWTNDKGIAEEAPRQTWHYAKLPSDGKPADLQFVDVPLNGEYPYAMSREEKDALLNPPIHIKSREEDKDVLLQQGLVLGFGLVKAPQVRFKDLEEAVAHNIKFTAVPFTMTTSSFRVTDLTDWVTVKLEVNGKDLHWAIDGDARHAKLRYYARVVSITGRIVAQFEDEMDIGQAGEENRTYSFGKAVPLSGGLYRLNVVMQDVGGDSFGTWTGGVRVQPDSQLSSIVLSESASDPVFQPAQQQTTFSPGSPIHAFAQLYKLAVDPKTSQPDASIDYQVFATSAKKPVSVGHFTDSTATLNQRGEQISLTKELPAPPPGSYDLILRVVDNIAKQQGCTQTQFTVK